MKKFLNPFEYIAGWQALAVGVAAMLVKSAAACLTGQSFDGVMHITYADVTFWQTLAQQLVCWLIFATLLYAAARIFSHSRVRALDIYGTNLFARIPILPMLLTVFLIGRDLTAALMSSDVIEVAAANSGRLLIVGVIDIVLVAWYYVWSYKAFSVSSNLKGGRAVAIFVVCCLIAVVAAAPLLKLIG